MAYKEIHFWGFPKEINIKFDDEFRKDFFSKVVSHFDISMKAGEFLNKKAKEYGLKRRFTGSHIRMHKTAEHTKRHIPVWMIKKFCDEIELDRREVEKHIISYRVKGGLLITNPKLPILITPEFDSIIAHLMGDGTDRKTRNGATSYTQVSLIGRRQFYQKLVNVFGDVEPTTFSEDKDYIGVPKSIVLILKHYYKINTFDTYNSRIPEEIKLNSKEHKLAFLSAFLVDEGTIYDIISLRVKNKGLIEDLLEIAKSLGYKCSDIKSFVDWTNSSVYGFNISNFSLDKLLKDINTLSKSFPICNLAQKQENLEFLVSLGRLSVAKRKPKKTKNLILSSLKLGPKTVMELAKDVNVCRRTVRGHLEDLKNLNKIKIKGLKGKAKLWVIESEITAVPRSY